MTLIQINPNVRVIILMAVVLVLLGLAYLAGHILRRQPDNTFNPAIIQAFIRRVKAWILMAAIVFTAFLLGKVVTVFLFYLVSFWAVREFITLTPTRKGDHRTLFWVIVVFPIVQYVLVGLGQRFYGLYSVLIPVYASLFIPARIALSGDFKRFLERAAKIQLGLLICVYALSHAPALLDLPSGERSLTAQDRTNREVQADSPDPPANRELGGFGLMLYLILVVLVSDLSFFVWGQVLGRRVIAPQIHSGRTWEGLLGGLLSTTLIGSVLWSLTPFGILEAAFLSLVIGMSGFAGSMTMSAIKRDRGVKDYGTLVEGHAGILDRIDSLCFAAPIYFHLTRLLI